MLSKKTMVFGLVMLALVAFMGCAKAPQEAIDAAQAALDAAKAVEADRYAADLYNAAKDTLDAALSEVQTQNGKFALTRSYGTAQTLLAAATNAANAAKDAAGANKAKVQAEAQQFLLDAQAAVNASKELLRRAPRGKETRAALEAMQTDMAAIEATLAEANTAMSSGDYLTARDKANASMSNANSIAEEIKTAMAKKKALAGRR
jgi:hypothetical protein